MGKHTIGDLKQMQSLPLEAKIRMTQRRIKDWFDHWDGEVYVSFSGGKDSTVLKHIVDNTPGVYDVPAVFVNTGLEYPEIQKFVKDVQRGTWDCFNPDVTIIRPDARFDEVLRKYGYPVIGKKQADVIELARKSLENGKYTFRLRALGITEEEARGMGLELPDREMLDRYEKSAVGSIYVMPQHRHFLTADFRVSAKCCNEMKKKPAEKYCKETGRKPILATMADESQMRRNAWLKNGCNSFESAKPSSQPMAFWTEQDVLHYLKKYNVPYCPVYGEIKLKQVVDNERCFEGQINMLDLLEDYDDRDVLETTGCERTGGIYCMFGCNKDKTPNRFQMLKETHPRQYEYCIGGGEMVNGEWQPSKEGLGLAKVLDYIGVKYD